MANTIISVKLWADSHGTDYHHLPAILLSLFRGTNFSRFSAPEIDALGGRKITPNIVGKIIGDMNLRSGSGQPQVHVVFLGSNNIRRGSNPQEIIPLLRRIADHAIKMCHTHVVFCAALPGIENDHILKSKFMTLNSMIKQLSKEFRSKCSFLNLAKRFTSFGQVKVELYDDGIHLNHEGAQLLAKVIGGHLQRLPSHLFM